MVDHWAIDDADLDVYQFRMISHIARVGICWKSIRTLADDCKMSVGKASQVRQWLLKNSHIETAVDPKTDRMGYKVSSQYERSRSEQTQQHRSPDEQNVHDMNRAFTTRTERSPDEHERSPDEHERSPHEPKTITIRQQPKTTTEEDIYIPTEPEPIARMKTAVSAISKETLWAKTESLFTEAAYELIGRDAKPEQVTAFGVWWKDNGWHSGKPALQNILDHWQDFGDGRSLKKSANGNSGKNGRKLLAEKSKPVIGEF